MLVLVMMLVLVLVLALVMMLVLVLVLMLGHVVVLGLVLVQADAAAVGAPPSPPGYDILPWRLQPPRNESAPSS